MSDLPLPADRPRTGAGRQWWTLTTRGIGGIVRNGEIVFAFLAPAFLAICFYLPLRSVMDRFAGVDYAAFLMPIIALQSVAFVATSAAMRASLDTLSGINTRFRTLPMSLSTPAMARLSANTVLLVISVVCAAVASLLMGWRPGGGVWGTVGMYAVVMTVGILIAILADAIGLLSNSPEATSQAIGLPVLILGMLSTGFVPESVFPSWIAPFARNQPISQFVNTVRAFDLDTMSWGVFAPTLYWCLGLLAAGLALTLIGVRRVKS